MRVKVIPAAIVAGMLALTLAGCSSSSEAPVNATDTDRCAALVEAGETYGRTGDPASLGPVATVAPDLDDPGLLRQWHVIVGGSADALATMAPGMRAYALDRLDTAVSAGVAMCRQQKTPVD